MTDHEIARSIGHILGFKGKDGVWGWINQNLPMFKITQIDTIKPKPALLDAWDKSNLFQKVLMFRPTSLIVGSIADAIKEKPGVTFTFHYNPQSVESQVLSVLGFTPAQTRQHITNLFPSHSFETTLPFQALTLDAIPTAADEIAKQLSVPHYEQRL